MKKTNERIERVMAERMLLHLVNLKLITKDEHEILLEKASGRTVKYEIAPRRPGDIGACYANPDKAATILGWRAEYDMERMCVDAARWQSQNPDGYPNE